jgi:uncharacterized membrane protein YeaQ/YmgE (transglycosylase-associated protein family)
MLLLNCLWVGVLAGLVGSRLIRSGEGFVSPGSSAAVGVLGAFLGGLSKARFAHPADLPHGDILAAGVGAILALLVWGAAQRLLLSRSRSQGR